MKENDKERRVRSLYKKSSSI